MTHVYEGEPDARLSGDEMVSRFRPRYRPLSPEEIALHDLLKAKAAELEQLFNEVVLRKPVDRVHYHELAMTSLEQSIMWIVKELTS